MNLKHLFNIDDKSEAVSERCLQMFFKKALFVQYCLSINPESRCLRAFLVLRVCFNSSDTLICFCYIFNICTCDKVSMVVIFLFLNNWSLM